MFLLRWCSSAAISSGPPYLCQLTVNISRITRRNPRNYFVESPQQSRSFPFAKTPEPVMKFCDSFAHNFALRKSQTIRCSFEPLDRL
jgi:hypothetical protein